MSDETDAFVGIFERQPERTATSSAPAHDAPGAPATEAPRTPLEQEPDPVAALPPSPGRKPGSSPVPPASRAAAPHRGGTPAVKSGPTHRTAPRAQRPRAASTHTTTGAPPTARAGVRTPAAPQEPVAAKETPPTERPASVTKPTAGAGPPTGAGASADAGPPAVEDTEHAAEEVTPLATAAPDVYARRRRTLTHVVIAATILGGILVWHQMGRHPSPGVHRSAAAATPAAPSPAQQERATAQVDKVLATAQQWKASHGTYVGWSPSVAGFAAATAPHEVVLTAKIAGLCYYSGIIPGQPARVLSSPKACAPGALAQVQAQFDQETTATAHADTLSLTQALHAAEVAASFWARSHVGPTGPSFTGLPALAGVTATVHGNGASVTLVARAGNGACLSETLQASAPGAAAPGAC